MAATKDLINQVMQNQLGAFANNFKRDYSTGGTKLKNLVNKANNPFVLALGQEIVIYSTLMRSLDSSLGNCLERIARAIAESSYYVYDVVEGDVPIGIDQKISDLMNMYTSKRRKPQLSDLDEITITATGQTEHKIHKSDYHLVKRSDESQHFLLELKIGGDLDNKKARSEKQALLEQYAILKYSPRIRNDSSIRLYFATAYNFSGEDEIWSQERVRQFFSEDELLIGRDFWNFISDSSEGTAPLTGEIREKD
ncbi:MAG TPA: TdeIII family type II restriction endonuclease [Ktedonobacteraceae bacterium]|nr:TdeIII family type II restriction endonuclease [Ktedonobacteraceae bacterium]